MAKFGKLELTDDSDEEIEETTVTWKRQRAVEMIIISSDEEGEKSSDLSSLPPSPAPVRRNPLESHIVGSRERKAAKRVEATGDSFRSTGKSLQDGASNRDDEEVTVLDRPSRNDGSRLTVQKKKVTDDRKEEDSDNDSVYEIPPPAQARGVQGSVASKAKIPYQNRPNDPPTQSSTIFTSGNRLVHIQSTPSSSRLHTSHRNEAPNPRKLKQELLGEPVVKRPQKQPSETTSLGQSKRTQKAPIRLLLPPKTLSVPHNSYTAVTARETSTSSKTATSVSNPFTSRALIVHPNRSSAPKSPALSSVSATAAPTPNPTDATEAETQVAIVAHKRATTPRDDANSSQNISPETSGSPEGTDCVAELLEDPRAHVENSTQDHQPYVLNSDYDKQLYQVVGSHWPPLARMREQVANARVVVNTDAESVSASASEGGAELPIRNSHRHGGLRHEPTCACLPGGQRCDKIGGCVLLQDWKPRREGVSGTAAVTDDGNPETRQERTHQLGENVSVALAMRRYMERLWDAASSVSGIFAGMPVERENGGDGEPEATRGGVSVGDGDDVAEEGGTPTLFPEVTPAKHRQEGPCELRVSLSNADSTTPSQTPATSPTQNGSTTPVTFNTPTTELSTAATLVNDAAVLKESSPSPAILVTTLKPVSQASRLSTLGRSSIAVTGIDDERHRQMHNAYDFSYTSTAMRIDSTEWHPNSFAMVRTTAPDSKSVSSSGFPLPIEPSNSPTQIEIPDSPISVDPPSSKVTSYRPTRHFLGVEPPRIPGTKSYTLQAARELTTGRESIREEETFSDVDDLSESEMNPDALALYQAIRFYQEHLEDDLDDAMDNRKRKAVNSGSSTPEEEAEYDGHVAPKKKAPRGSRKRRKTSRSTSQIDSGSLPPISNSATGSTARPLLLRSTGTSVQVPLGISVDEIDTSCIEVRQVKEGTVTVTALCHQCRCHNTNAARKAQCGNVTTRQSYSSTASASFNTAGSSRCNKTFCERCLRGWYGFDDDAISFVKGGQRWIEGQRIGTGIGLGIVEERWICPFCINLCMCTVCSRKRNVERTRYAPSANAVIAVVTAGALARRPKPAGSEATQRKARPAANASEADSQTSSSIHTPVIRLPRRIAPPTVPVQWLPAIPTPTAGLDPIYYEATRPCTRYFPTGAPQPTAANHAPIVYHVGAELENDGLEDSFTGSETSGDEGDAGGKPGQSLVRMSSKLDTPGNPAHAARGMVAPSTRKNFLVVTPGQRMPSTTKKMHWHSKDPVSNRLTGLSVQGKATGTPNGTTHILDGISNDSFEPFVDPESNEDSPIFDHYPTTVDPMDLFGASSSSHREESLVQSTPAMTDLLESDINIDSQYTGSPCFQDPSLDPDEVTVCSILADDGGTPWDRHSGPLYDNFATRANESVQRMSPNLSNGDYSDFFPITGDDYNEDATILMADANGDILMDEGPLYPLLGRPLSDQESGTSSSQPDPVAATHTLLGDGLYSPNSTTSVDEGESIALPRVAVNSMHSSSDVLFSFNSGA